MASARTPGKIALPRGRIDAWAWSKRVTGTCSCDPGYATVVVRVNGVEYETPREGERFSVTVPLREGANHIVASCRHRDGLQCAPAEMTIRQRLKARPKAAIRITAGPDCILLDSRASEPDEANDSEIVRYRWRADKGNPAPLSLGPATDTSHPSMPLNVPKQDGEYRVSLRLTDAREMSDTATACFIVKGGKARVPDLETENPSWVESAVLYGMVPHNSGPDGFRSVIARLDYLKDLGIDAIWLAPCTDTKGRGHGYGVSDYFRLRRDYGTKRDFRQLVKEAHAQGIRVLMDFVPNHSSLHHPYMQHAAKHGRTSPYHDFYEWQQDGEHFAHYFHWRHLPNLNYDNPEVRRWMMEAFSYWVHQFDVDGFRVDAAWGVKLRRPDFWSAWRRELKRIKPDLLLLAEASARDPYYFTDGFDAAYDWTDELGKWAWEHVFDDPDSTVERLRAALTNGERGFHEDALIFRFLNNNDTGPRFITRYGVEIEKVAAAMLLTLPGLPCIYTGQEVGAEFEPYRTLGPISWEDKHRLRDHYRQLIALRKALPSLHGRGWRLLESRSAHQCLAYLRYCEVTGAAALVVLNFSAEDAAADVAIPDEFAWLARQGRLRDVFAEADVPVEQLSGDAIRIHLGPFSARVLVCGH